MKQPLYNDVLNNGDIIYVCSYIKNTFEFLTDKIHEYYTGKGFTYTITKNLGDSNLIVVESETWEQFLLIEDKNNVNPEYSKAVSQQKRIIQFTKFSEIIHSELIIITDDIFENLKSMIHSGQDDIKIACDIMGNANRTDKESIKNLLKLTYEFNASLFSGISKPSLYKISPSMYELFLFLEREYKEEYKSFYIK